MPPAYPDADPPLSCARGPSSFGPRPGRWRCRTRAAGGPTCRAPTGRHPKGPDSEEARAEPIIRSPMSRSRTRRRTRNGPASSCRARPSGSTRHAAASTAQRFAWGDEERPGGELMANHWQGEFPWRNTGGDYQWRPAAASRRLACDRSSERRTDGESQIGRRLKASLAFLPQAAPHNALQRRRHTRKLCRLVLQNRVHHLHRGLAAECLAAGQHLVKDHAEAEDIGARIHRFAAHLLGRHVARCPNHGAGIG